MVNHDQSTDSPDVSFVIACYNAKSYLEEAVRSALGQQGVSVEVLIVDDHSSDGSFDFAKDLAAGYPRIRVLQTPENLGPGGARNVGIENARGHWFAVLDSDDLLAPERSLDLLGEAERTGADIVADNLLLFGESVKSHAYLTDPPVGADGWIGLRTYFAGTRMFAAQPNLGFLKPMIRMDALQAGPYRYREDLRIGEDDELIIQLLLGGLKYHYVHTPLYHYRKHDESISHRLSSQNSERMLQSENNISAALDEAGAISPEYAARYASIKDAAAFTRSVDALKRKDPIAAISALIKRPFAIRHYSMPIKARIEKLLARRSSTS